MEGQTIAYDVSRWTSFFSAETSASAALTGLLFVAISINLQQIVKTPALASRAGKALATLTAVLVVSSLCLVPGQSRVALGVEVAAAAVVMWVMSTVLQYRAAHNNPYINRSTRSFHMGLTQASALPMLAGAISIIVARGGGLRWLVAGTIVSLLSAMLDAWVLLIEIQR